MSLSDPRYSVEVKFSRFLSVILAVFRYYPGFGRFALTKCVVEEIAGVVCSVGIRDEKKEKTPEREEVLTRI